tara:strand:- start:64 stop:441 length:378 start_codon:yes stop_codon:yes gene_type:complete
MATKYITKLAAGRRSTPFAFTGLSSQGSTSPNEQLNQYGHGGSIGTAVTTPCSLAARSVQIYVQVGAGGESHGSVPFIASGATGEVKMSMAYGYDLTPFFNWVSPGFDFVTSGEICLGSDGNATG